MKLLVTGAAGYLGSEICRQAEARGDEVIAAVRQARPPYGSAIPMDVRDMGTVEGVLTKHGPDAVIHTAFVQDGPAMMDTIVKGSRILGEAAHRAGARLVHVSTDLVFDGEQGAPYDEDADPRPVMVYGAAKLAAERLVVRADPDALVVRTSLLYGKPEPGPQERLAERTDIAFYTDEIRCPARVDEVAAALLDLAGRDLGGILHVAGPEAISRYELARRLRAAAGLDPAAVRGAASPRDGRARDVALDSSRAAALLGGPLHGLEPV